MIVPAHNAEATLAQSLESALAGSYCNFELLIVDDGSSDETPRIADRFAREDDRVQLHRRAQGGVSAALNLGLRHARGDYVARLDSDDIWHPTKLEKQMAVVNADPAVALVYTGVRYIDADGFVVRDVAPQRFERGALAHILYSGLIGGNSSVLMSRSAAIDAGGYDETLISWEDLFLFASICASHPVACVPEYLVGYRVRPGSLSADLRNMLGSWSLARRLIGRRFPQVPSFVHRWGHGRRTAELAEGFAWKGRYFTAARLLFDALLHDPVRTSSLLAYRLRRRLGGKARADESAAPHFSDCDVAQPYRLSAFDSGLEGTRLRVLEAKRARTLDALDRRWRSAASGRGAA